MKCLSAALFLFAATSAFALEWKTQSLTLKAGPLDLTAETAFDFTNNSDQTVTILRVDTSCDCLSATPSARTFEPGASGRINAHFQLGSRTGTFLRMITVTTDEDESATLRVQIEVGELATFTPRVVDWKRDDAPAEQCIEIKVADGLEVMFGNVQATSDAFKFRLETLEAGRSYRLHVEPRSTKKTANAALRLNAKASTGQAVVLSVYANVR